MMKNWYLSWFNSPYYHLLYKDRDHREAEFFLDKLLDKLVPEQGCSIIDIACGKGRHSVYLNRKGFNVTGIDLSHESIKHCKQFENDTLEFYEHDMRTIFRVNYFDMALNLFTSFGYFEREHDNALVLRSAASALKPGGIFVVDYFNSAKVKNGLPAVFKKERNNIEFSFEKKDAGGRVVKSIRVNDSGKEFLFNESVWLYSKEDFEKMFSGCGLRLKSVYGDYALRDFDENQSERLIMITEKV